MKTFGRRGGRALSTRQHNLIETLLPKLRPPAASAQTLDPSTLFDGASEVWLEIGFGGGEHVTGQAIRHKDIGILACEVFQEGIAKCLGQIAEAGLTNVCVWDDDARDLMQSLASDSVDRVFILFPDPWPKARHQKRRLIQPDFLSALARIVKPGGCVRFATDVRSYADEALVRFLAHGRYRWRATCAADWRDVPSDHIPTRYQLKNLGDIRPVYYDFEVIGST
ncbi:MAG: tRNA (guanosine(46)-N7)-methyltransferase TrmB [Pseudomonadota bacterium]